MSNLPDDVTPAMLDGAMCAAQACVICNRKTEYTCEVCEQRICDTAKCETEHMINDGHGSVFDPETVP